MGFETFGFYIGEDVTLNLLTLCDRFWSGGRCCRGRSCRGSFRRGCASGRRRRGLVERVGKVVFRLIVRKGTIFADARRTIARGPERINGK